MTKISLSAWLIVVFLGNLAVRRNSSEDNFTTFPSLCGALDLCWVNLSNSMVPRALPRGWPDLHDGEEKSQSLFFKRPHTEPTAKSTIQSLMLGW